MNSNGSNTGGLDQPKRPSDPPLLHERYPLNTTRQKSSVTRPYFIDFVRKSGKREAFAYTDLIWIVCESPKQVVFHFSSHTAVVTGRRLQSLYDRALSQELGRVEEVDERYASDVDEGPVVSDIKTPRVETKRTEMDQDFPIESEGEGE